MLNKTDAISRVVRMLNLGTDWEHRKPMQKMRMATGKGTHIVTIATTEQSAQHETSFLRTRFLQTFSFYFDFVNFVSFLLKTKK